MSSKLALVPAHSLVRRSGETSSALRRAIGATALAASGHSVANPRSNLSQSGLLDARGRVLGDLRLSVTDRCNLRCTYCMPKEVFGPGYQFLPKKELLTFEELTEVASAFVALGVCKIRLTGGEPLLRAELPVLVAMLSKLEVELALTTNGVLLAKHAESLAKAGLARVTVSLDALSDFNLRRMSGKPNASVAPILEGIKRATEVGLGVKVNTVVRRGVNEEEVLPLVAWCREAGIAVRFIEYMDVGHTNHWLLDDVEPADQLLARIQERYPLVPAPVIKPSDVARRYHHADGHGEVGFIASVTQPFCGDCTRARVSAKGELFTCLFAEKGVDLRATLRSSGASATRELIVSTWQQRRDRYSEVRGSLTPEQGKTMDGSPRIEMSYIGG